MPLTTSHFLVGADALSAVYPDRIVSGAACSNGTRASKPGNRGMEDLLIIAVRGIGAGSIFALVGMSFNVVYNSSGILNFAQGNLLVLGGLFAYLVLPGAPSTAQWWIFLPLVAAALLAVLIAVQGGITLAPLRSSVEQHSWLITTLAASVIIGGDPADLPGQRAADRAQPVRRVFACWARACRLTYALTSVLAVFWCVALTLFHTAC